jgi:hypothetical protein
VTTRVTRRTHTDRDARHMRKQLSHVCVAPPPWSP